MKMMPKMTAAAPSSIRRMTGMTDMMAAQGGAKDNRDSQEGSMVAASRSRQHAARSATDVEMEAA